MKNYYKITSMNNDLHLEFYKTAKAYASKVELNK